jgi:glycosyltransferase involved in cell wall biosynthesis
LEAGTLTPEVSIVILSWQHPEVIDICLRSLVPTEGSYEVIVVDNGSGPETVNALREHQAEGRIDVLVEEPENRYFSEGNNIGVAHSNPGSKYILILNSDVAFLRPDWLVKMVAWMEGTITYRAAAWDFAPAAPKPGPRDIVSLNYSNDHTIEGGVRPEGECCLIRRSWWRDISTDFPWLYGFDEMLANAIRDGARCGLLSQPALGNLQSPYIFHRKHGSTKSPAEAAELNAKLAQIPTRRQPDMTGWYAGLADRIECLDFTPGPNERDSFLVW